MAKLKRTEKNNDCSFETGMLAYARSIQITEGLFFGTQQAVDSFKIPVEVNEKGVRGQSSEDKAKNAGKSNPQSVEYAVLPQGCDGVELSFSIRFMPLSLRPHACGSTLVGDTHSRFAEGYKLAGGYRILAELYVWNIVNARFAWRNRFQSDHMSVTIVFSGTTLKFDPMKLSLEKPSSHSELVAALIEGSTEELEELVSGITIGLSNDDKRAFCAKISWNAKMESAQEIFPSQEYVRDLKKDDQLSRVYAKLPTQYGRQTISQASMHSQKIGAALRHIDIWHESETHVGAIAVNPYGGVQETSEILRPSKSKNSFYDIRAKANELLSEVESVGKAEDISPNAHFFMANLVRGGVFGSSSKKAEANG